MWKRIHYKKQLAFGEQYTFFFLQKCVLDLSLSGATQQELSNAAFSIQGMRLFLKLGRAGIYCCLINMTYNAFGTGEILSLILHGSTCYS